MPRNVTLLDVDFYPYLDVQGDVRYLPFRDESFDFVILLDVLEHVPNVEDALREALRVARRGVVISYPDEDVEECARQRDLVKYFEYLRKKGAVINERMPKVRVGGEEVFIHHIHWKSREMVEKDVRLITEVCGPPIELRDEYYRGWGWVCLKRR